MLWLPGILRPVLSTHPHPHLFLHAFIPHPLEVSVQASHTDPVDLCRADGVNTDPGAAFFTGHPVPPHPHPPPTPKR